MATARNAPCPCGSGKKYKHCCALKAERSSWTARIIGALIALALLTGAVVMLTSIGDLDSDPSGSRSGWLP